VNFLKQDVNSTKFIPHSFVYFGIHAITTNSLAVEFLMKTLNEILPLEIEASDDHCSLKPWARMKQFSFWQSPLIVNTLILRIINNNQFV